MKRKERPYIRRVDRISGEREKPKFRMIKVTENGVRQCTVDLVSASALDAATSAFLNAKTAAPIITEECQIELIA